MVALVLLAAPQLRADGTREESRGVTVKDARRSEEDASRAGAPASDSRGRLSAREKRGRQLFLRGTSATGRDVTALFGDDLIEVPASSLPCVNCHDHDGSGRPEGGVSPSDIRQAALTKPYGVAHPSGRQHPAYDDRSLRDAITQGRDPAHNRLSTAMPRYLLTHDEAEDLIAYLKRLGTYTDPGLDSESIRLGTILPTSGAGKDVGEAVRRVLESYFQDLNAAGGIYGRRVDLRIAGTGSSAEESVTAVRRLVDDDEVFALVGAFVEGAEAGVDALLEQEEVPLIGAVTSSPLNGFPLNRYVFYLLAGIEEQARVLLDFAVDTLGKAPARLAVVSSEGDPDRGIAKAIETRCTAAGWAAPRLVRCSSESTELSRTVAELRRDDVTALFIASTGSVQGDLLREAARSEWYPSVFVPGPLMARTLLDAPAGFDGKVFLSFPRGPADKTEDGLAEYRAFAARHGLSSRQLAAQVGTYATLKVLTEGLKRAGREVSREKLILTLEGLYEYKTGLTPPITFGPNRRIGALGAYVATLTPGTRSLTPVSGWIKLR